jgi:predicted dehydrogenase
MVVYDDCSPEPLKVYNRGVEYEDPGTFGDWRLSYRTGDIRTPHISGEEPLSLEIADFIHSIRTGRRPVSGLALARDVVMLAEAADRSLETGGDQVDLAPGTPLPLAA